MKVAIIYNKDLSGVLNKFGMQNKEFYSEKNVKIVAKCLEQAGHNTTIIDGNMYVIERLQNFMPRTIDGEQMGMVFNMAYGIQGESRYPQQRHLGSHAEQVHCHLTRVRRGGEDTPSRRGALRIRQFPVGLE